MTANAIVQARIDSEIKEQASAVLENMGLTLSDAVRILLTRIAKDGALPAGLTTDKAAHDAWFRAKVQEALDSPDPPLADDVVETHFAQRRASALLKANKG